MIKNNSIHIHNSFVLCSVHLNNRDLTPKVKQMLSKEQRTQSLTMMNGINIGILVVFLIYNVKSESKFTKVIQMWNFAYKN